MSSRKSLLSDEISNEEQYKNLKYWEILLTFRKVCLAEEYIQME